MRTFNSLLAMLLLSGVANSAVLTVCSSGCNYALTAIQTAVNDAVPGDIITINGVASTTTGLELPLKTNPDKKFIVIRSASVWALGANVRPASDNSNLAEITHTTNGYQTMFADPGASYYRFEGIRFTPIHNSTNKFNMIQFAKIVSGKGAEHEQSDLPDHIEFDQCVFMGYPGEDGPFRAIYANMKALTVTNSLFQDIKNQNGEAQSIAGFNGAGPFYFRNNRFETTTMDTLIGGAPPNMRGQRIKDLYFGGNYYYRRWDQRMRKSAADPTGACMSDATSGEVWINTTIGATNPYWQCQSGTWTAITETQLQTTWVNNGPSAGSGTTTPGSCTAANTFWNTTDDTYFRCASGVYGQISYADARYFTWWQKNHFELKNAERAYVEGNVIENSWLPTAQSQHGAAFLFNQVDGDSGLGVSADPSAVVSHVLVINNRTRYNPWCVSNGTLGTYHYKNDNISFVNNLCETGDEPYSNGDALTFQVQSKMRRQKYAYNTVITRNQTNNSSLSMQLGGGSSSVCPVTPSSCWDLNQEVSFYGNIIPWNGNGFYNDNGNAGSGSSQSFTNSWAPNRMFAKNVFVRNIPTESLTSVQNNFLLADSNGKKACDTCIAALDYDNGGSNDVGFTDFANRNYRMSASSPYKGMWSLGKPAGADMDDIDNATATTVAGTYNPYLDFIVRAVKPGTTTMDVRYTCPTTAVCYTIASTSPDYSNPVYNAGDGGGPDRDRLVTLVGLTTKTRYFVKVYQGTMKREFQRNTY